MRRFVHASRTWVKSNEDKGGRNWHRIRNGRRDKNNERGERRGRWEREQKDGDKQRQTPLALIISWLFWSYSSCSPENTNTHWLWFTNTKNKPEKQAPNMSNMSTIYTVFFFVVVFHARTNIPVISGHSFCDDGTDVLTKTRHTPLVIMSPTELFSLLMQQQVNNR